MAFDREAYFERLKDPRWQQKRLRILERDAWKCLVCQRTDRTLHVHHCYYEAHADPWDYPEQSLLTLCEHCHEMETVELREAMGFLRKALGENGFLGCHVHLLGYLIHTFGERTGSLSTQTMVSDICWLLTTGRLRAGPVFESFLAGIHEIRSEWERQLEADLDSNREA